MLDFLEKEEAVSPALLRELRAYREASDDDLCFALCISR